MEDSHTFERTENSLEHWITYTYVIDSMTVETETTMSVIHWKGYSKLPIFFIKNTLF